MSSTYVTLAHLSPDGDMDYPGEVKVKVTFELTNDNEVVINYTASVRKKATPINLTSHPYFNLGGEVCECGQGIFTVLSAAYTMCMYTVPKIYLHAGGSSQSSQFLFFL